MDGARRLLGRVAQALDRSRVEETAACARALTALAGRLPPIELLSGGRAQVVRAALTGRIIAAQEPVPWPCAIQRQLDPDDPAFLPPLGIHPVLAARDRTWLSLPGRDRRAWIDPHGWCGVADGPSVTIWISEGRKAYTMGRGPGDGREGHYSVIQVRSRCGVGIVTRCFRGDLTVELTHWPVVLSGTLAWAMRIEVSLEAPAPRPVRVGVAIRPSGFEGVAPIFHLTRDVDGLWMADGTPLLLLGRSGDELLVGKYGQPDPWLVFSGSRFGSGLQRAGPVDLRCPVGQGSAVEVYRTTLFPKEPFKLLGVLSPAADVSTVLVRTSERTLWSGAQADRRGLLAAGCQFQLLEHQTLLEACKIRLLSDASVGGLGAALGAVALARLGFTRRACERLARWLSIIRRGRNLGLTDPHDLPVLGWALAETLRWTGEVAWAQELLPGWCWLLDELTALESPKPGGVAVFGPEGSEGWTRLWTAAALLSSAAALRDLVEDHQAWALSGGLLRESLLEGLGGRAWSASPERAADGSAAGLLAACWLGLVGEDHPGVAATCAVLRERFWYGGGILLHGGANTAATVLFSVVNGRRDTSFDALGTVSRLASPTGAIPTVRHPRRGALEEGDDGLSAALFTLLALDQIRAWQGRLFIGAQLGQVRNLPTPYGRIDFERTDDGPRLVGRWSGRAPSIHIQEDVSGGS